MCLPCRPDKSAALVMHCLKGKRASEAADKLSLLGFHDVKIYKGSFLDWKENEGPIEEMQ